MLNSRRIVLGGPWKNCEGFEMNFKESYTHLITPHKVLNRPDKSSTYLWKFSKRDNQVEIGLKVLKSLS